MSRPDLRGRVVVVTGAARGIGRATALQLSALGAKVAGCDVDGAALQATLDECRARGIRSVAVTAGYIGAAARREFYAKMDAANVDLKGFTEDFYVKLCGARLAPVLETLRYLVHETDVWTEITTLLIPGKNDSDDEWQSVVITVNGAYYVTAAQLRPYGDISLSPRLMYDASGKEAPSNLVISEIHIACNEGDAFLLKGGQTQ